jgi:hypothetical protein
METHLFQVKVNQQGRSLLLRMKKWAIFFYGCTIVTGVFDCVNAYLILEGYKKYANSYSYYLKFQSIVSIVFLLLYSFLLIFSARYFYQFTSKSVTAVEQDNEIEYNNNLNFLLRHVVVSSILFTLNSLWSLMLAFMQIRTGY